MLCLRALLASIKVEQSCSMKSHRLFHAVSQSCLPNRSNPVPNIRSRYIRSAKIKTALAFVFSIAGFHMAFASDNCREPEAGTEKIPLFSPPLGAKVIGSGHLQFYSVPDPDCAMEGIFVIPKNKLIVYAQSSDGWSSVTYANRRTGNVASGWVRSSRLKTTGTVGPKQ